MQDPMFTGLPAMLQNLPFLIVSGAFKHFARRVKWDGYALQTGSCGRMGDRMAGALVVAGGNPPACVGGQNDFPFRAEWQRRGVGARRSPDIAHDPA